MRKPQVNTLNAQHKPPRGQENAIHRDLVYGGSDGYTTRVFLGSIQPRMQWDQRNRMAING